MAVQISGNDITVPRDGTFSRNVSIAGTLTYEDVTNVDSIGLVTARNGIEVGASPGVGASISVDGNAIFSGITTATTLKSTTGIVTTLTSTGLTIDAGTSSEYPLKLSKSDSSAVYIQYLNSTTGSSTSDGFRVGVDSNEDALVWLREDGNIKFGTDNSERIRFGGDGQIGIAGANYGTSGQVITSQGSGSAVQWATPSSGLYSGYALMEEAIEHGATAHTKTAGNWYTKQLTRISFDPQSIIVSLSSNDFTLAAGTYVIKWVHFLERCDSGLTRLYDVTNSTSKKVSMCGFAQDSGNFAGINSRGIARVTISGNTTYRYQYFVESANSILYGPADSDNTEEEIFGQVEVWKEY